MGKKKRKLALQEARSEKNRSWLVLAVYVMAALSLAVPFLGSVIEVHQYLQPFYSKALIFQLLTEAMFVCWILLAIARPTYRPVWRNPVVLGLAVLALATLTVLPFAIDPAYSFWSRPGRMTGVVNYLHYYAWLFIVVSTVKSARDFRPLVAVSCLTALAVGIYGFAFSSPGHSLVSTLDNSSFFGAYMMTHVFLAAYLWTSGRERWSRVSAVAIVAVGVPAVILSGSRGAALITAVGIVFAGTVLLMASAASRARKTALVLTLAVFVLVTVGTVALLRSGSVRPWGESHLPAAAQRIVYRDFGHDRWVLWKYALKGFVERPIVGWGNEQYELMFYKYYDPLGTDRVNLNENFADRAHNQYLDALVAGGAVSQSGKK